MKGFEPTIFQTSGGQLSLSTALERLLGKRGNVLLFIDKSVNRIICLRQALTGHDLNIFAMASVLWVGTNIMCMWLPHSRNFNLFFLTSVLFRYSHTSLLVCLIQILTSTVLHRTLQQDANKTLAKSSKYFTH